MSLSSQLSNDEKFSYIWDSTQLFFNVDWHIRLYPDRSELHSKKMEQLQKQFETEVECDCSSCIKLSPGSDMRDALVHIVRIGKYSICEDLFVCKDCDGSYYSVLNNCETKVADAYWYPTFDKLLDGISDFHYGSTDRYKIKLLRLLDQF